MQLYPMPSNLLTSRLSETVTELRQQIETTSEEAVTGQRADLTSHLDGRVGQAMLSQKALDGIELQRDQFALRSSRLDITQRSLSTIQDSVAGIDTAMLSALGFEDRGSQAAVARDARSALEQTFSALNVRQGARFLFAGDATATQPFGSVDTLINDIQQIASTSADAAAFEAALDTYFDTPGGGFEANIYQGTATGSDGEAVLGNDPTLKQIIRGLSVLSASSTTDVLPVSGDNRSVLESAAKILTVGQTDLTIRRSEVGLTQGRLDQDIEALNVEEQVLTTTFNALAGRDQYEAASALRELERNLEASYLLTTRLANLSLLNFLR